MLKINPENIENNLPVLRRHMDYYVIAQAGVVKAYTDVTGCAEAMTTQIASMIAHAENSVAYTEAETFNTETTRAFTVDKIA